MPFVFASDLKNNPFVAEESIAPMYIKVLNKPAEAPMCLGEA